MIRAWRRAAVIGAFAAGAVAAPAVLSAPTPTPYIHLRVTQARDSSGRTIASVWLDTNAGTSGVEEWPLVYTQPWHTTCQADPRMPLPGGKTPVIYLPTFNAGNQIVRLQHVVRIPTTRAQQVTLCGYLVPIYAPPSPFVVSAQTTLPVAIQPPRGRNPLPLNQGPWRSCAANRKVQVVRLLANRNLASGCAKATTIAHTWIAQWHQNHDQWDMWENGPPYYPSVVHTYSPMPTLHRTLSCQATKVLPIGDFQPEVVNCGLASFKFDPGL